MSATVFSLQTSLFQAATSLESLGDLSAFEAAYEKAMENFSDGSSPGLHLSAVMAGAKTACGESGSALPGLLHDALMALFTVNDINLQILTRDFPVMLEDLSSEYSGGRLALRALANTVATSLSVDWGELHGDEA